MTIHKVSDASECMAILTKKKQESENSDFAAIFAQCCAPTQFSTNELTHGTLIGSKIKETSVPLTMFTDFARGPITDSTAWRQSSNYTQFREQFLNPSKIEYTDDMFSKTPSGSMVINDKGMEQLNKWRIDTVRSMAPSSIADAENKFQAGWEHLNNYIHTMFMDQGIEMDFNYQPQIGINGQYFIGATIPASGPNSDGTMQKYYNFINSDYGDEMRVMAEEVQFYGAITDLANANSDFNEAYNNDPKAAIDKYYREIASTMNNIKMPRVQTIPNYTMTAAGYYS